MFGRNGYKILKCFRKEQRVSGKLPCPVTRLIISWNVFTICKLLRDDFPADSVKLIGFTPDEKYWEKNLCKKVFVMKYATSR